MRLRQLAFALVLGFSTWPLAAELRTLVNAPAPAAPVAVPPGKTPYTVSLPWLPDAALTGQYVDVFVRRVTNDSRVDDYMVLLSSVVVLSAPAINPLGAPGRQATLALDDKEIKKVQKFERVGHEIILRPREAP